MTATPQLDVQLYKVPDAMRMLNLSRTVIFELLRTGAAALGQARPHPTLRMTTPFGPTVMV